MTQMYKNFMPYCHEYCTIWLISKTTAVDNSNVQEFYIVQPTIKCPIMCTLHSISIHQYCKTISTRKRPIKTTLSQHMS